MFPVLAAFALSQPAFPTVDISDHYFHHVVVDREAKQYLGHPTTLLLEDGKTILCVYPKGHGAGAIVYKRSSDGGKTWSDRLPTPESWKTSKETPTLHRVIDPQGKKRVILFSGLHPIRMASSDDDGQTWSELKPIGPFGGIVAMGTVFELKPGPGHYMALFHDDGRYFLPNAPKRKPGEPIKFTLYQTISKDGGLTWGEPHAILDSVEKHHCEPGAIRSPDGKQIAVLLRENTRKFHSHIIFSDDEGKTWTEPKELPLSLTGDRHTGKYAPDGRIFFTFRDMAPKSPTQGDWVGWVGTYDDLKSQKPGQYRVRILDNTKGFDSSYPGLELLPDGTFVTTTYGHWTKNQPPYIMSVRFKLSELDELQKK
jgi:hypothetical protein